MKIRVLIVVIASLITSFSSNLLAAQYVNDFNCTVNEGYSVPQLVAFKQEYVAAAREIGGFDENYQVKLMIPIYNKKVAVPPKHFTWRGYFKDGAQMGQVNDWFLTQPEWGRKFGEVMTCEDASLWVSL